MLEKIYKMDWIDICIDTELTLEQKIYLLKFLFEKR